MCIRDRPITFGHALMAYASMLLRDLQRFEDATARMDAQCPLGSGALALSLIHIFDGKVYTAATVGTVLPGVTRRSCIELLKDWGYEVVEGKIAIADIMAAAREGKLEEVFVTGTAAVVSPVKELVWKGEHAFIGDGKIGPVTQKLYDTMTGMQSVSYTHLDVYKRQGLHCRHRGHRSARRHPPQLHRAAEGLGL